MRFVNLPFAKLNHFHFPNGWSKCINHFEWWANKTKTTQSNTEYFAHCEWSRVKIYGMEEHHLHREQFLQCVYDTHIGCDVNRFVPNSEWLNEMPQDDSTVNSTHSTTKTKKKHTHSLFFRWMCAGAHIISPALNAHFDCAYATHTNI